MASRHLDENCNVDGVERVKFVSGGLHVDRPDGEEQLSASRRSSLQNITPLKENKLSAFSSSILDQELSEQNKAALQTYSSLSYAPSHSLVYMTWLRSQGARLLVAVEWDRWLLCFIIGLLVGLTAVLLNQATGALGKIRLDYLKDYAREGDLLSAWGWNTLFTCLYILIASFLVAFIHPLAAGGGTPEIIAYLNGILVHGAICLRQLVTKFIALVFTVSAGFPVGTQGPLIVFGACIGSGLGQFRSRSLGCSPKLFTRFRNREDRRQFTTVGVAAGVSAGFDAPIGSLMIAMEDLASFWSKRLSWQTLFCSIVSIATAKLFNTAFTGFQYGGTFGPLNVSIVEPLRIHIAVLLPALVLGIVGGVVGAFFTRLSALIVAKRKEFLAKISNETFRKTVRMADALVIALIMAAYTTYLPKGFDCEVFSISNHTTTQIRQCVFYTNNMSINDVDLEKYTCSQTGLDVTDQVNYNGAATLVQGGAASIFDKLWTRGRHWAYGWDECLAIFAVWMLLNCYITSGCATAGGIFVPCVVTGALYGRALGVGMLYIWRSVDGSDTPVGTAWDWMDPGLIAVLGSASMLGGVTRLALTTTVLMVEMSRDIELTIPIMITVLVARTVGEALSKSLFRYLIDAKSLPFLDQDPRVILDKQIVNLELHTVSEVMARAVVTVYPVMSLPALARVLRDTSHGGIPVVKYDKETRTEKVYGILTRIELYKLILSKAVQEAKGEDILIKPDVEFQQLSVDYLDDVKEAEAAIEVFYNSKQHSGIFVDLEPFINRSVMKVDQDYSLHRAYQIFRTLGLRHLLVTDIHNRLLGIVTRKDLIQYRLQSQLQEANGMMAAGIEVDYQKDDVKSNGGVINYGFTSDDNNTAL